MWYNGDRVKRGAERMRRTLKNIVQRYFRHDVGRSSAALTYYLIFAAFPLIVFFSTLLGLLELNFESVLRALDQILPSDVESIIRGYFNYVQNNQSGKLMAFSLVFSIWFPMRASSCLMRSVQRAFGPRYQKTGFRVQLRTLLFTVWLVGTLSVSAVLLTVGRRALRWVNQYIRLPSGLADLWNHLRFVLLAFLLFMTLAVLYMVALGERRPLKDVSAGIVVSLAAWMGLSALFSYYVEHIATYSQLYGSIATVVVTLLWLYMSATVIIMGAELNAVLVIRRRRKAKRKALAQKKEEK